MSRLRPACMASIMVPLTLMLTLATWFNAPTECLGQSPAGQNTPRQLSGRHTPQGWTKPRRPLPVRTASSKSITSRNRSGRDIELVGAELDTPSSLPSEHGQVWQEYDIGAITAKLSAGRSQDYKPEQAIVDWVLRETGTDIWFGEPLGLMSASQGKLRVYHTRDVQNQVADVVERFTQGDASKQAFGVRLVTLSSPNWRAKASARMAPVNVQTPGVEAWLVSREDAAIILEQIRKRSDFREHSSPNLLIQNGQTHVIERRRPISYIRGMRAALGTAGGYQMDQGQVSEGFTLAVSPLLSQNRADVDAVIRLETTQIEKLTSMALPTPTVANPRKTSTIQVPQTSSWRLHERFHWPSQQVLIISCGVIADPGPKRSQVIALPIAKRPARADALLFVESKGRYEELISVPQAANANTGINYRGRY